MMIMQAMGLERKLKAYKVLLPAYKVLLPSSPNGYTTELSICTLQCILLSCDTVCDFAVFRMTAHDICAISPHDHVCEQLMGAHGIYANNAFGICK